MQCQCDSASSPTGPPPAGRSGCSELTPSWRFIPHSTTRCAIFAEPSARFVWTARHRYRSWPTIKPGHPPAIGMASPTSGNRTSSGHQRDEHLDHVMTNQLVLNRLYCVPNSLITRVEVGQNNTVAYWLNVRPRPAAPCRSRAPAPPGSHGKCEPRLPPRGVVLPLLGVVDWSQSRATARPIDSAERARNRKARSHDRPWNHLAHRRIPPQDIDSVDHRNHPARHRRRSRDPGFSGTPCGRPAPLLLMTNLPSRMGEPGAGQLELTARIRLFPTTQPE